MNLDRLMTKIHYGVLGFAVIYFGLHLIIDPQRKAIKNAISTCCENPFSNIGEVIK